MNSEEPNTLDASGMTYEQVQEALRYATQAQLDLLKRLEEQAKVQNGRALNGEITKEWFIDRTAITRERERLEGEQS